MERPKIRVGQPHLGALEVDYVTAAIEAGDIGHFGPQVKALEVEFAAYCGAEHGVAVSSGTAALHVALAALGVGPGDQVIVPALTMIATINAVTYLGAEPVIVDVTADTWTMDPSATAAAVTDRTMVLLPVHLYGHPADMDPLRELAEHHDLYILEDAAEAHGAAYRGSPAGSLGTAAAFSFYLNKVMTTGEGGMVVTSEEEVANRARLLRDQAFSPHDRFVHETLGYNYRLTNLQAALGCAQLKRIDELIAAKRANAALYRALLGDLPGIVLPPDAPWADSVYWMFAVLIEDDASIERDELRRRLAAAGIETRGFFVPLHRQPLYAQLSGGRSFPVAERLSQHGLYLPSGSGLRANDIETVAYEVARALSRGSS